MSSKNLIIFTTLILIAESSQQNDSRIEEKCDMTWEFSPSYCNGEAPSASKCRYGPPKNISHCTDLSVGVIKNEPYNSELLTGKRTKSRPTKTIVLKQMFTFYFG